MDAVLLYCVSDLAAAATGHAEARAGGEQHEVVEQKMADCLIRICSLAQHLGLDPGRAAIAKLK